jgi:hypothetical protein
MDPLLARLETGMLPFARLLGLRFTHAEPDRVVAERSCARTCARGPRSCTAGR